MKKCLFIILGCFVMLTGCNSVTNSSEQTVVNKAKSKASYEKSDTVESLLSNSYSVKGMNAKTVSFDPRTNTYIVVVQTALLASVLETLKDSDEWNKFASGFLNLTSSTTEIAQNTDKTINIKVILMSSDSLPILEVVNKDTEFNFFDANDSQRIEVLLESYICSNGLGVPSISFNKETNTYTANITKEGLGKDFANSSVWKEYSENTAKLQPLIENIIHSIDKNSKLIVQYNDINDGDKLLTVENGNITYNYNK